MQNKNRHNELVIKSLVAGAILNFILPFAYNGDLVTKSMLSIGNPVLILPYTFFIFLLLISVSESDITNAGKVVVDRPRDIPKTILKSTLEIIFGIVFGLIVPVFGSMYIFWRFESVRLATLVFVIYISLLIFLGRKFYRARFYK